MLPVALVAITALAPTTAALAFGNHVVQPGETLSSIADQYGVTVSALAQANDIPDPNIIYTGETIVVGDRNANYTADASSATAAPAVTHVVQPGDMLSVLATTYGVALNALAQANSIANPNAIYVGEVLTIPSVPLDQPVSHAEAASILRQAETEFGIPRGLLLSLGWMESGFQQGIVSYAGAIGLLQLLPDTADWAIQQFVPDATDWRTSATDNARLGAAVLAFYLKFFGGDETSALGAYYQGLRSVITVGLYPESQQYAATIIAAIPEFQLTTYGQQRPGER
jgi:LysM repeat protein